MRVIFFKVSTNGFISFGRNFVTDSYFVEELPISQQLPLIAPFWADLTFRQGGRLYYRVTEDRDFLNNVAERIRTENVAYEGYRPTQALVATWFQSRIFSKNFSVCLDDIPCIMHYNQICLL